MLSESQRNSSNANSISPELNVALWKLINKSRLANGWSTKTAEELDDTIEEWGRILKKYGIPVDALPELYDRAFDVRQAKFQASGYIVSIDATLLVSQWTGENGLAKELRTRSIIPPDRRLYEELPKVCGTCFDTGIQAIGENRGEFCDHQPKKPKVSPQTSAQNVQPLRYVVETEEEIIMRAYHSIKDLRGREALQNALAYVRDQRYTKPVENVVENNVDPNDDVPF